jgi:APA family basic amino acid/polyamine antiporter
LRKTDPSRRRPVRTPAVYIIAPLAIIGCLGLYFSLPLTAILVLPGWGAIGLIVYFLYSRSRSHVGLGITEVVSDDDLAPLPPGSI